jgi:hypothetical protein
MLSDVVLEVARAVVMTVIFTFMVIVGHRQSLYEQRGYDRLAAADPAD